MSKELTESKDVQAKQMKLQVKYEDLTARYANHVVLNTGQEEVFLDFSSGMIPDQGTGVTIMPIHTRIAMTPGGARRLYQVLHQLFTKQEGGPTPADVKKN